MNTATLFLRALEVTLSTCEHQLHGLINPEPCANCALIVTMAKREPSYDSRWHSYRCTLVDMVNSPEVTGEERRRPRPKAACKLGRKRKARLVR